MATTNTPPDPATQEIHVEITIGPKGDPRSEKLIIDWLGGASAEPTGEWHRGDGTLHANSALTIVGPGGPIPDGKILIEGGPAGFARELRLPKWSVSGDNDTEGYCFTWRDNNPFRSKTKCLP